MEDEMDEVLYDEEGEPLPTFTYDDTKTQGGVFKEMARQYEAESERIRNGGLGENCLKAAFDNHCRNENLTPEQRKEQSIPWSDEEEAAAQTYAYGVTAIHKFFASPLPGEKIPGIEPFAFFPLPARQKLPTEPAEVTRLFALSRWAWWHSLKSTEQESESQTIIPEYTAVLSSGFFSSLFRFEIVQEETPSTAPEQVLRAVICQWIEEDEDSANRFKERLESDPQWLTLVKEYTGRLRVSTADRILRDWLFPTTPSMVAYFALRTSEQDVSEHLPRRGVRLTSVVLHTPDTLDDLLNTDDVSHASKDETAKSKSPSDSVLSTVQVVQEMQLATRYSDSTETLYVRAVRKLYKTRAWIEEVCRYRLTIGGEQERISEEEKRLYDDYKILVAKGTCTLDMYHYLRESIWQQKRIQHKSRTGHDDSATFCL